MAGTGTTHLLGTADADQLALNRPTVERFAEQDIELGSIDLLQVMSETSMSSTTETLPVGVHPSFPGHVSWQIWRCPDSSIGSFSLAINRIGCRLGIKPRCFATRAVVDNAEVGRVLAEGWGYSVQVGDVGLQRGYDRVRGTVELDGRTVLDVELTDPVLFTGSAIRYPADLHLAHTSRGLRLVQADASYEFEKIERGSAVVNQFDPTAWDSGALAPTWPVVATLAKVRTTLHGVRFLSDPHLQASEGTEDLKALRAAANGHG
jgi:hypothetical protein